MVENKFDEGFLSGIKADLVSMEDCHHHQRGKGFGGKLYVVRQSTV